MEKMDRFEGDRKESRDDRTTRQIMGRGSRAWLQRDNTGLRRPHGASTGNQSSTGPVPSTTTEYNLEEKKFSLSPQAKEFIPRSMSSRSQMLQSSLSQPSVSDFDPFLSPTSQPIHQPPKSSVQDRIRIARETPLTAYVPPRLIDNDEALEDSLQQCSVQDSEMGYYDEYKDGQDDLNGSKKEEEEEQNEVEEVYNHETCQRLNNIINILILNPAEFTKLIPPFVNKLICDGNMRCLQMVVTNIIEWSIGESNFRYNGARFCKYFDTILEDSKELFISKELYRDLLSFQCKLEARFQDTEWRQQRKEERDQRKCNGLILFLAELVAQMDESYAFTLGELLVWFITRVLQRPASSSVKYICQALKLAGRVLEKDKSRSKDMENMMRALTELVNNGQVDTHVGNMVNSVHELRKDWERNASNCDLSGTSNALSNEVQQQPDQLGASNYNSSGSNTTSLREVQHSLDQPIMYGPDGNILSAEESKFLQDQIKLDLDDQGTSEEASEDDNYDDEIASAYEEFLRDKPK